MTNRLQLDPSMLHQFQAIAEPTRLRIVQLLTAGERCVCDLQTDLDAAQSRLSFHLRKLREAGILADRRDGRWVYYSLVPETLEAMREFLGDVTAAEKRAGTEAGCCGATGSPGIGMASC